MQWKIGDKVLYPTNQPGTVEIIDEQDGHLAVLVLLDTGGRELLLGPAEVAMLLPEFVAKLVSSCRHRASRPKLGRRYPPLDAYVRQAPRLSLSSRGLARPDRVRAPLPGPVGTNLLLPCAMLRAGPGEPCARVSRSG
jgi:hypothetical protein